MGSVNTSPSASCQSAPTAACPASWRSRCCRSSPDGAIGQMDRASAPSRLGLGQFPARCPPRARERPTHGQGASVEVHVRPGQAEHLALPQAGRGRDRHERPQGVVATGVEEAAQFVALEVLDFAARDPWGSGQRRHITADKTVADRVAERLAERHTASDRGASRQATLHQASRQTLDIARLEHGQPSVAEGRQDVVADMVLAVPPRRGPHPRLLGIEPSHQVVTEGDRTAGSAACRQFGPEGIHATAHIGLGPTGERLALEGAVGIRPRHRTAPSVPLRVMPEAAVAVRGARSTLDRLAHRVRSSLSGARP